MPVFASLKFERDLNSTKPTDLLLPPDIYEALALPSLVALDLETTGLDASTHDIIEVGAARIEFGTVTETFSQLIQIPGDLPLHITRLTGIRPEDLRNQPFLDEVLPRLVEWIGDDPIMGHNIGFDMGFLDESFNAQGSLFQFSGPLGPLRNPRLDTLILARALLPRLRDHRLETLIEFFHIPVFHSHRALEDVFSEIRLFDRLVLLLLTQPDHVLEQFSRILVSLTDGTSGLIRHARAAAPYFRPKLVSQAQALLQGLSAPRNNIIGEALSRPPSGESLTLDEEEVAAIFDDSGLLSSTRSDFERRDQQIDMARMVTRAFNEQAFFLAEAGTGTGKSLAYLVPAILWARRHAPENGRVVVSTNTKNLQEQIFTKDLPFLFEHLTPFQAVLLKGRGNYLCLLRWQQFLLDLPEEIHQPEEFWELLPVVTWLEETISGDIEENNGFHNQFYPDLWSRIRADAHFCPGKKCPFYETCFVFRARKAARQADIVVVNHSLLLSDLAANRSILSEYANLILDEAHNLEWAATQFLSVELTSWSIRNFLHQLYRFAGKETGLLPFLRDVFQRISVSSTLQSRVLSILYGLIQLVGALEKSCRAFFSQLSEKGWALNLARGLPLNAKMRYLNWEESFGTLAPATRDLRDGLEELKRDLQRLQDGLLLLDLSQFPELESALPLLEGALEQATELLGQLKLLTETPREDQIYWVELPPADRKQDSKLKASPLNVASILKNRLYDGLNTAIFTSATLTVGEKFDYFKSRTGLSFVDPERLLEASYDSPFFYEEQVLLGVPGFLSDPRQPGFVDHVADLIVKTVTLTRRGTLILFTSYDMLQRVYRRIKPALEGEGILTLGQGQDGSRNALVRIFQEDGRAVLLGTNSFWEGVDIPGEPLEILILTKLPFEVPADPVFQAWMEEIERRGGNSFFQLSVPLAVLKFRQGFGRLIRSGSDRGIVLILDSRVLRFQYGRLFLDSLPLEVRVFENEEQLLFEAK